MSRNASGQLKHNARASLSRGQRINLFALAIYVATSLAVIRALTPLLPASERALVIGIFLAYGSLWIISAVWLNLRERTYGASETVSYRFNLLIMWGGNAAVIVGFLVLMPHADEGWQMLMVIFLLGPVAVEALGTVRRPPVNGRDSLAPLAIPTAISLYYLVQGGRFAIAVSLFMGAFAAIMLALRGVIQRAVDRAYAARLSAEGARADAEAQRDSKTRFLASASHDLAQPLQSARLFFDQAVRGTDPTRRANAITMAHGAFALMERQLRQMLDHLRLEAGAVQPHIMNLAVGPLIARVAALAEVGADRAAIDIRLQPSRLRVRADPDLTERALSNLVDNARKHARCSRILLGARRVGARVRIWVIDDGVGIPGADLPRLFDDYVQGSNHDDEIRGGFGLGLASVQRMMALMSGAAGLDPRWRRGSAFYLDFAAVDESATDATITGAAKE